MFVILMLVVDGRLCGHDEPIHPPPPQRSAHALTPNFQRNALFKLPINAFRHVLAKKPHLPR